jgi:hypothetical protein
MEQDDKVKDFVKFQIRRNITNLFKSFFIVLDDLNITDEQYQKYRKRILDDANNKIREIEEIFDNLDVAFKIYENRK